MDKRFQWTEFYMELASALLPYKNNRSELIAKLKTIFADAGMNFPFKERGKEVYEDICPFTVFGSFNKGITYEAQCAALRLKRKIELIQAKKNRQEMVIISAIEETLDNEFAEYQKQLNEQIDKMNDALKRSKAEVLSDEDNKELKKLYRKIVKALHPDINPDVSEAQVQLFDNAVSAYKNGDLGTLRIIGEMVGNNPLPEQHKDAMTQLVEERERLEGLLKSIRESIENIKSEYPYTMKDILEDTKKTEQKKQELESVIEQYNELISIYKAKIEEMLR